MAAPGLLPGIGVNPYTQGGAPGGGLGNPAANPANPAQNNAYMQNLMSQVPARLLPYTVFLRYSFIIYCVSSLV